MDFFRFKTLVKQFPFLPFVLRSDKIRDQGMSAVEKDESGVYQWIHQLHCLLSSVCIQRADARLLLAVGSRSTWSGSAGSTDNYTVYVAVWKLGEEWDFAVLGYNQDHSSASGRDDWSEMSVHIGEQLAEMGVDPDYVVEVERSEQWEGPLRRSVVIHKMTPGLLPAWTREQLVKVAEELAAELEAAFAE